MDPLPKVTEAVIRQHASSDSYQRGREYYEQGAVVRVVRRDQQLQAEVEGRPVRALQGADHLRCRWYRPGHLWLPLRLEYVRDTCICHAWHIHVYLNHQDMPSKGGRRIVSRDFMTYSFA